MKLFFITFAAAALLSTTALANPPGNQGGGNGGCGVGQQTNGCGSTTPVTTTATVSIDSHNVSNRVDNSVHDSSIKNTLTTGSSNSTSQGGSASVGNVSTGPSTASAVTGASTSSASTGPSSASSQSGGNVQDVHFDSPRQVASAIAPALILPSCTDGGSGAVQGARIGISIGGSKQAKGCERRAYAAMLDAFGEREAAVLVLSNDPEVNAAVTRARSKK